MSDDKGFVGKLAASGHKLPAITVDCTGMDLGELFSAPAGEDGPLVQAHKQGRAIHLDNLGNAQPGTDGSLALAIMAVTGEIPKWDYKSPSGTEYTFSKGVGNFSLTVSPLGIEARDTLGVTTASRIMNNRLVAGPSGVNAVDRLAQQREGQQGERQR